uniref:Uncharacterized protein n=1 Tax=Micrurus corallinus TaxID=54390 RepID=A0A2D4FFQ5_MICCO
MLSLFPRLLSERDSTREERRIQKDGGEKKINQKRPAEKVVIFLQDQMQKGVGAQDEKTAQLKNRDTGFGNKIIFSTVKGMEKYRVGGSDIRDEKGGGKGI